MWAKQNKLDLQIPPLDPHRLGFPGKPVCFNAVTWTHREIQAQETKILPKAFMLQYVSVPQEPKEEIID